MEIQGSPSVVFDYWLDVSLPDGTPVTLLQYAGLNLPLGWSFTGPYGVFVPAGIPLGSYHFDNVTGNFLTGEVYGADGFDADYLGN